MNIPSSIIKQSWAESKQLPTYSNNSKVIHTVLSNEQFSNEVKRAMWLLRSRALFFTNNEADAKDLIQDTLYRAYSKRARFTMWSNFKARSSKIMQNIFYDQRRQGKRRENIRNTIDSTEWEALHVAWNDTSGLDLLNIEQIKEYIDQIDTMHSVPFMMFTNWWKYQEIADHVWVPMWTIKSRIHNARQKLQQIVIDNEL